MERSLLPQHFSMKMLQRNNTILITLLRDNTITQLIDHAACNNDSEPSVYLNGLAAGLHVCPSYSRCTSTDNPTPVRSCWSRVCLHVCPSYSRCTSTDSPTPVRSCWSRVRLHVCPSYSRCTSTDSPTPVRSCWSRVCLHVCPSYSRCPQQTTQPP